MHHDKKQSFAPYAIIIIIAIILVAVTNVGAVYYGYKITEQKQQQLVSSITNTSNVNQQVLLEGLKVGTLYHGQIMWLLGNNTKTIVDNTAKLNSLIDAHNQLVKAIENATGKPQIINKQTFIHNTYCYIKVVSPKCNHK